MGRFLKRQRPGTWISVKDRLPEAGQEVLILERFEDEPLNIISVSTYDSKASDDIWANVTHWMEIPKVQKILNSSERLKRSSEDIFTKQ